MMAVPPLSTLVIPYAYWGITTIPLFWAPLIRATREWGSDDSPGRAFGLLDGGRGLLAAVMGSFMVTLFAALLPADSETASLAQRTETLRQIILLLSAITCGAALLVWLAPPNRDSARPSEEPQLSLSGIAHVLAMPSVWLQAAIILCAYVGFKAIYDFSLYANQVIGLRPVAAISAGYLADRIGAPTMTTGSFVMLTAGSVVLASGGH